MMKKTASMYKKLKVTDYIIAIILCVAVGYGFLYFSSKYQSVYLEMTPQNTDWSTESTQSIYQEADAIQEGDKVFNSLGQQVAEVYSVTTASFGGTKRSVKLIIKVRSKYNPRTKVYSYNDTPLLIGNILSLSIGKVSFRGKILNIYEKPEDKYKNYTYKNIIATVLFRGVEPSHAEAMKSFIAKNSKGEIIAKTLESDIRPQEYDTTTDRGEVLKANSTIYKDCTLKLLLPKVPCSHDTCFFNDIVDLKIGIRYFWVHSDATFLNGGIITNIEYPDQKTAQPPRE